MPVLTDYTKKQQQLLAGFCRHGKGVAPDGMYAGLENRYRSLVFNVVKDALENAYPVFRSMLNADEWADLCHEFFSEHGCQSAQIWELPRELAEYMISSGHPLLVRFPWLQNLLIFEWMEVELYMMEDISTSHQTHGNPFSDILVMNPECRLLQLEFPVHSKKPADLSAADRGEYFLFMYREPETGHVKFISVSAFLAQALLFITEKNITFSQLMELLSGMAPDTDKDELRKELTTWVGNLAEKKIIIGYI